MNHLINWGKIVKIKRYADTCIFIAKGIQTDISQQVFVANDIHNACHTVARDAFSG